MGDFIIEESLDRGLHHLFYLLEFFDCAGCIGSVIAAAPLEIVSVILVCGERCGDDCTYVFHL